VSTTLLNRPFDAAELPGSAELASLREQAFERFARTGFPDRRQEDWRYTDLKPLAQTEFDLDTRERTAPPDLESFLASAGLAGAGSTLVFVDGVYKPGLSTLDGHGRATVASLAERWPTLDSKYARLMLETPHPLANLNTALSRDGALIVVPDGVEVERPLHLVFVGTAGRVAPQPRVIVDLGVNAELTLVEHFIDTHIVDTWLNVVTQVEQAAGSRLKLYRLQQHATGTFHTALLRARLGRDAHLEAGYVEFGGRLVRNDLDVTLAEPGAEVDLFGLVVAGGKQHVDNHLRVDHAAANTRSNEEFRAIVGDRAHGVFNGKVIVRPDSQRIDARQSSDNLLLSDTAEIDTKPELEIYADDVKCSHGATIGELDPQQIFYLRARGIDERTARGLLTLAFANRILERISLAPVRESAMASVAGQLPDRELREALQ
jgi:Fe-S cluster assembly protein SufD